MTLDNSSYFVGFVIGVTTDDLTPAASVSKGSIIPQRKICSVAAVIPTGSWIQGVSLIRQELRNTTCVVTG